MLDFGIPDVLNVATNLVVCGAACAGLKFSGFRVGPIRAVTLAIKSRWFGRHVETNSVRTRQVATLDLYLGEDKYRTSSEFYMVVIGEKGVGKTCMIDTCLKGMKGIVRVTIPPSISEKEITSICHNAIIGGAFLWDQCDDANRVLFWYNLFFRQMPVIVITVEETFYQQQQPAELTGAVARSLTRRGINVVVDGTLTSFHPGLLCNNRELVIEVEGLSREEVRSMPQLKDLFTVLDDAKLSSVVLDLLGGNPSLHLELLDEVQRSKLAQQGRQTDVAAVVVPEFLLALLNQMHRKALYMVVKQPLFEEIFALFQDHQQICKTELIIRRLTIPPSSWSCQILHHRGKFHVVPSSPLAALYLKNDRDLTKAQDVVRQLIKEARAESGQDLEGN